MKVFLDFHVICGDVYKFIAHLWECIKKFCVIHVKSNYSSMPRGLAKTPLLLVRFFNNAIYVLMTRFCIVYIMACRLFGDKSLFELILTRCQLGPLEQISISLQ